MTPQTLFLAVLALLVAAPPAAADATPQPLPYVQSWSDNALISVDDDWSGVGGVVGYRGDDLAAGEGVDPQTVLVDGATTPVDVIANRTSPAAVFPGGVAEFELADPVVGLRGSITADAPHLLVVLDATGTAEVRVRYAVRDLDTSENDAVQAVALQYRTGGSGEYENVPAAFVPDATAAPGDAPRVTPVDVALPAAAAGQPLLELRIVTTNAAGTDEWIGIDDVAVTDAATPPSDTTPPALELALERNGRIAQALARGVRAAVTLDEPAALRTTLRISRRLAKRLGIGRVVGTADHAADAGVTRVTTRIAPRARRKLARIARFRVTLVVRAKDAAGNASRAEAAIVLRR